MRTFVGRLRPALLALVLVLLTPGGLTREQVVRAASSDATTAKKVCKTVKQHGKKKLVCKKVQTPAATVAARLAKRLSTAGSDEDRYRVLVSVFKALGIGVYTPRGRAVVRGHEHGPKDFYTYDFELQAMSAALGQKRFWSASDLAAIFALLFAPGAPAPTTETIQTGLRQATRASLKKPKAARSLLPLLVRDIGLRHAAPYDLANELPASRLQLDALQLFLISAQTLLPLLGSAHSQGQSELLNGQGVFRKHSVSRVDCGTYKGSRGNWQLDPNISKMILGEGNYAGLSGVVTVAKVVDVLQGIEIGRIALIVGSPTPITGNDTHYGPAGHAPLAGKVLKFTVSVQSDFKYSSPVDCGTLAGFTPPRGGVADIPVKWLAVEGDLSQHGELTYDPPLVGDQQFTGTNGEATLIFTPKDETMPGVGEEQGADYGVVGEPLIQDAKVSPTIKPLFAAAGNPVLPFGGRITWHQSVGFSFSGRLDHMVGAADATDSIDLFMSGHVCGSRYGTPWDIALHADFYDTDGDEIPNHATELHGDQAAKVTFSPGAEPVDPTYFWGTWHFKILDGPPPQMEIRWVADPTDPAGWMPTEQVKTVPLVSDPSCH